MLLTLRREQERAVTPFQKIKLDTPKGSPHFDGGRINYVKWGGLDVSRQRKGEVDAGISPLSSPSVWNLRQITLARAMRALGAAEEAVGISTRETRRE